MKHQPPEWLYFNDDPGAIVTARDGANAYRYGWFCGVQGRYQKTDNTRPVHPELAPLWDEGLHDYLDSMRD